jgi:glycosyltransferase involved in cell wall biosynthesis
VLSVSSIEPRKNQTSILLAAEQLWREGQQFQLLFIAGDGWLRDDFDAELKRAQDAGRPVRVISKASEELLWAAYQLARFSVFVSLAEGYGLPAAESIGSGTPVVLTNYGSMAEIGEAGGAAMVDPRSLGEITTAMRRLLSDDEYLELLRRETREYPVSTWGDYASNTWAWLTEGE